MCPRKLNMSARPLDRLPEPYRTELLADISLTEVEGRPFSCDAEEQAVRRIEADLANGGRELRRLKVLREDKLQKQRTRGLPLIQVRVPLPRW